MFVQNMHGQMVNISEFQSIRIAYKKRGMLQGHHIVGHRTFDRDKVALHDNFRETLGIYHFRMQAETVYEDLMKASKNSETFRMPDPVKLVEQAEADGTLEVLREYEDLWLKEDGRNTVPGSSCGCIIGVFLVVGFLLLLSWLLW